MAVLIDNKTKIEIDIHNEIGEENDDELNQLYAHYSVVKKNHLSNGKFFPFPIFISVSKIDYKKFLNEKKIQINYGQTKVCVLKINSFYIVDKKKNWKKNIQYI